MIVELNSIALNEIKKTSIKTTFEKIWEAAFCLTMFRKIDGFVGVTGEITNYYLNKTKDGLTPHITIENGIDVSEVKIRTPPVFSGESLEMIAVANISNWHAFERLFEGMVEYSGDTNILLHIVGDGALKNKLENIMRQMNLESKVIFHGFLAGVALDELFNRCHVAVGSLGLHRVGLSEATPLKSREYCARGIPFIIGYTDPDFPPSFPYVSVFSSDDTFIDMNEIINFTKSVYIDMSHHMSMREYAEMHLDWNIKMTRLKSFIESNYAKYDLYIE